MLASIPDSLWVALGVIVGAFLTFLGVVLTNRSKAPGEHVTALATTIDRLVQDNERLNGRLEKSDERLTKAETNIISLQDRLEKCYSELKGLLEKWVSPLKPPTSLDDTPPTDIFE